MRKIGYHEQCLYDTKDGKACNTCSTFKANPATHQTKSFYGDAKPIKGQSGVYVVKVEKTTDAQVAANYVKEKMELQSGLEGSLQSQVTQSLVKLADIVDNRKFYFKNIRR